MSAGAESPAWAMILHGKNIPNPLPEPMPLPRGRDPDAPVQTTTSAAEYIRAMYLAWISAFEVHWSRQKQAQVQAQRLGRPTQTPVPEPVAKSTPPPAPSTPTESKSKAKVKPKTAKPPPIQTDLVMPAGPSTLDSAGKRRKKVSKKEGVGAV
jgi:hypothetical protein